MRATRSERRSLRRANLCREWSIIPRASWRWGCVPPRLIPTGERCKVEKQETTISQLRSTVAQQQKDFQATVAQLTARLDEQASQIQKVSAQFAAASPSRGGLEVNRQAPQVVSNNQ